jgi:hypothetical protein
VRLVLLVPERGFEPRTYWLRCGALPIKLEQFHVRWLHNRSGQKRRTRVATGAVVTDIPGAATVIVKLQVLILPNANML